MLTVTYIERGDGYYVLHLRRKHYMLVPDITEARKKKGIRPNVCKRWKANY